MTIKLENVEDINNHLQVTPYYGESTYLGGKNSPSNVLYRVSIVDKNNKTVTGIHLGLCSSPTGNCQVGSISYACNIYDILSYFEVDKEMKKSLGAAFFRFFKNANNKFVGADFACYKRLMMFDILSHEFDRLKEYCIIVTEAPAYRSTNGSTLIMGIMNIG